MVAVFMGRRIECAQCHNHPFEAWSQDQFWGLAAFYGGVTELTESKVVLDAMKAGASDYISKAAIEERDRLWRVVQGALETYRLRRESELPTVVNPVIESEGAEAMGKR